MTFATRSSRFTLLATVLLTACGGEAGGPTGAPNGGPTGAPKGAPAVTSVSPIVGGQAVTITGEHLDGATLTADGVSVMTSSASGSALTFVAPPARPCETDGRAVALRVTNARGTTAATGRVSVGASTLSLRVAESRVLGPADLACLQIPRGPQAYALSWLSLRRTPVLDTLFVMQVFGASGALPPSTLPPPVPDAVASLRSALGTDANRSGAPAGPTRALAALHDHLRQPVDTSLPTSRAAAPALLEAASQRFAALTGRAPANPATAQVGDTVLITDWLGNGTYVTGGLVPMTVAAVSGRVVFLADPRHHAYGGVVASRARLTAAGAEVDRLLEPTLQSVFGTTYPVVHPGMNGRVFVLATRVAAGIIGTSVSQNVEPTTRDARSWNANTVALDPAYLSEAPAARIASTIMHENAHVVDFYAFGLARRSGGSAASSWIVEAVASLVTEVATRIATAQPVGARAVFTPIMSEWETLGAGWRSASPTRSLWSAEVASLPYRQLAGSYVFGAQVLLFARERAGESDYRTLRPTGTTLMERLFAEGPSKPDRIGRSVDDLGALVGLTGNELLDQAALGVITDDLVPATAAAVEKLPQFDSWNNAATLEQLTAGFNGASGPLSFSRTLSSRSAMTAGGGYWDARIIAGDPVAGVSMVFTPNPAAQYVLRITRLQ